MTRIYFQRASAGHTSPSGSVVSDIQSSLNALGIGQIAVDGQFGRQTENGLKAFQTANGLPVTGKVDEASWTQLTATAEPSIFQRALQLTAAFEGTGFRTIEGNFDGAGLTWGIIGFTLSNGELGGLLAQIAAQYPGVFANAFGSEAGYVLKKTSPATPVSERMAWADQISRRPNKTGVAEPWFSYFDALGSAIEVQKIQVEAARRRYWDLALKQATDLGMTEELDLALLFDVAVQNGGLGSKGRMKAVKDAFAAQKPKTAEDRRRIIAGVVTESIANKYKEDVRTRKFAYVEGAGTIHLADFAFADWGLIDGATPTSTT